MQGLLVVVVMECLHLEIKEVAAVMEEKDLVEKLSKCTWCAITKITFTIINKETEDLIFVE
jgi:hypothetical protein